MAPVGHDGNGKGSGDEGGAVPPISSLSIDAITSTQSSSSLVSISSQSWYSSLPSSNHVTFFLTTNWNNSPLGPLETWGTALRFYTFMVLTDSQPSCLYVGKERIGLYNEAFAPLAGTAHPSLMGASFKTAYPSMALPIHGHFEVAERTGMSVDVRELQMFVQRNGFVQETYFSGNFNPLRGEMGNIIAIHNSTHEVTRHVLSDRRTKMLNRMEIPSGSHHGTLASYVMPFLERNELDITMALLYEIDEEEAPAVTNLLLRGRIGVPAGHELAIEKADLDGTEGLVPTLRLARASGGVTTLPVDERFQGIRWGGFDEASKHYTILPLAGTARLFGFLIVGANSRRPIDEDHYQFMRDLRSQVTSIAASVITVEEQKKRNDRLERQLADNEKQIRFMAQNASVGMLHSRIDGSMIWANEQYFKLTGNVDEQKVRRWSNFIENFIEEDHPKALAAWQQLLRGEANISTELHLKKLFEPPSGEPEPSCILSHSFPYLENGNVKSVMTCMSDISALKWAERAEARKAFAAAEAKKHQEEFVDMVSHEMRNPLSAVYNGADTIIKSFVEVEAYGITEETLTEALKRNVESAKTIMAAAKLQKCIVDDILTLSKLQYQLLKVTPQPLQLQSLVESTVKMFESDLSAHKIDVRTSAGPSIKDNGVDWTLCDPARLTQILVNFLTNAIKFTKTETQREIAVTYGAVTSDPRANFPEGIHWAPKDPEMGDGSDALTSQKLYLTFTVKDTGVGMSTSEMQKLFNRFEQANAKTSIKYGGTGLGLFISKRLTERLGGEIGVIAEPGHGSLFAFYVQAERTEPQAADPPTPERRSPPKARTMSGPIDGEFPKQADDHMHVLLVEDNELNQKIVAKQLTQKGCVVTVANDGSEALQRLKESDVWAENNMKGGNRLDIILMDWEMPVMDGLTCAREIRSLEKAEKLTRHIEIIVTTANARDQQIAEALAAGGDSVISKPFIVGDLFQQMKQRLAASLNDTRITTIRTFSEP